LLGGRRQDNYIAETITKQRREEKRGRTGTETGDRRQKTELRAEGS